MRHALVGVMLFIGLGFAARAYLATTMNDVLKNAAKNSTAFKFTPPNYKQFNWQPAMIPQFNAKSIPTFNYQPPRVNIPQPPRIPQPIRVR
jgi:hypothetical protein